MYSSTCLDTQSNAGLELVHNIMLYQMPRGKNTQTLLLREAGDKYCSNLGIFVKNICKEYCFNCFGTLKTIEMDLENLCKKNTL